MRSSKDGPDALGGGASCSGSPCQGQQPAKSAFWTLGNGQVSESFTHLGLPGLQHLLLGHTHTDC